MWRDGHMFGCEHTQYLRSRNPEAVPSLYVYHADAALEVAAESYNVLGMVWPFTGVVPLSPGM